MAWRLNKRQAGALVCATFVLVSAAFVQATASQPAGTAESAYMLRMNGKLDEAKRILEETLAKDPDYAAAHYELARLKIHMGLGNPRAVADHLTEALQSIDQAVEKDPSNVAYLFFAGRIRFMRAYLAMQQGGSEIAEKVASSCDAFETALRFKPDYREAKLHLVELYGDAPEEWGGDKSKAETYMSELAKEDEIFGMKARSVLEEVTVSDWKSLRDKHPDNTDIIEELGKAYLGEENVDEAAKCFEEAIRIDPSNVILFLDLGRHHVFGAMRAMGSDDKKTLQPHLSAAKSAIRRYLEYEHPAPMKAYALGMLAKVNRGPGEQDEKKRLREEAQALDPHHSKATGCPPLVLFTPPAMILHNHRYMGRPY